MPATAAASPGLLASTWLTFDCRAWNLALLLLLLLLLLELVALELVLGDTAMPLDSAGREKRPRAQMMLPSGRTKSWEDL